MRNQQVFLIFLKEESKFPFVGKKKILDKMRISTAFHNYLMKSLSGTWSHWILDEYELFRGESGAFKVQKFVVSSDLKLTNFQKKMTKFISLFGEQIKQDIQESGLSDNRRVIHWVKKN